MQESMAMTIRCPECHVGLLNTPSILVRLEKSTRLTVPLKICHRCKVVLIEPAMLKGWKVWRGKDYVEIAC